ncbi:MAG: ribose-phosphate diphosphokinase, partial [Candidatus Omnitrophica bacterium]|nr:ribose-phosphate diphosphokinase [Candidatus Omnitrophota bacterium]
MLRSKDEKIRTLGQEVRFLISLVIELLQQDLLTQEDAETKRRDEILRFEQALNVFSKKHGEIIARLPVGLNKDDIAEHVKKILSAHPDYIAASKPLLDLLEGHIEKKEEEGDLEAMLDLMQLFTFVTDFIESPFVNGREKSPEAKVLFINDIIPQSLLEEELNQHNIVAIVCERGSSISHLSIIAEALDIPTLTGLGGVFSLVTPTDYIIVDGRNGEVIINPSNETIKRCTSDGLEIRAFEKYCQKKVDLTLAKEISQALEIVGSAQQEVELRRLKELGIKDIGLVRSELLKIFAKKEIPTVEEQLEAYLNIINAVEGMVTIRMLDKQPDKFIGCVPDSKLYGLEFYRSDPWGKILVRSQLEALILAHIKTGRIKILWPMISSFEDANFVLALYNEVKSELIMKGKISPEEAKDPEIGYMIELPAAVADRERIIDVANFVSIGTNDLIRFTFGLYDRDHISMDSRKYLETLQPALLTAIVQITESAIKRPGIQMCICGDIARYVKFALFILALNEHLHYSDKLKIALSMSATYIARFKEILRHVDLAKVEELFAAFFRGENVRAEDLDREVQRYVEEIIEEIKGSEEYKFFYQEYVLNRMQSANKNSSPLTQKIDLSQTLTALNPLAASAYALPAKRVGDGFLKVSYSFRQETVFFPLSAQIPSYRGRGPPKNAIYVSSPLKSSFRIVVAQERWQHMHALIAETKDLPFYKIDKTVFPDGDININIAIPSVLKGKDCTIIHPVFTDSDFVELMLAIGLLRDFGSRSISCVVQDTLLKDEALINVISNFAHISTIQEKFFISEDRSGLITTLSKYSRPKKMIPRLKNYIFSRILFSPSRDKILIFTESYAYLKERLAKKLGLPVVLINSEEINGRTIIDEHLPAIRNKGCLLIHSTRTSRGIVELVRILHLLTKGKAKEITLFIPYFAYSRQEDNYYMDRLGSIELERFSSDVAVQASLFCIGSPQELPDKGFSPYIIFILENARDIPAIIKKINKRKNILAVLSNVDLPLALKIPYIKINVSDMLKFYDVCAVKIDTQKNKIELYSSYRQGANSAKIILEIIRMFLDEIIVLNIHFFKQVKMDEFPAVKGLRITNINAFVHIVKYIKDKLGVGLEDIALIAPDKGIWEFVSATAQTLGIRSANYLEKTRLSSQKIEVRQKDLGVTDKTVIILDDIISTGGTMITAASLAREQGAKAVYLASTYGVFAKGLDVFKGKVNGVFTTNALGIAKNLLKDEMLEVIDIEDIIVEQIRQRSSSPIIERTPEDILAELDKTSGFFWRYLKDNPTARQILLRRLGDVLYDIKLPKLVNEKLKMNPLSIYVFGGVLWRSEADELQDLDVLTVIKGSATYKSLWELGNKPFYIEIIVRGEKDFASDPEIRNNLALLKLNTA